MRTERSFVLKPAEVVPKWFLVDAQHRIVGRVATVIASLLRGKHNPRYTPHTDSGDFVVVVNAEKVRFTGQKLTQKKYARHSGFVGGLKERAAKELLQTHPERVLIHAVKGMLSKNSLGRKQLTKLRVYRGPQHPHQAQRPEKVP